ncbi:MAG: hypothetical protein K0S56_1338 [Microvirga sp.]|jgi:sporulation protein YlmC with PRC-barrel domain|nr:hypothetical protein [Microvirga sp.]
MTQPEAPSDTKSTHPLIESSRVEGTRVYAPSGKHIGTIHHLIIEKVSGRVIYAVMTFGGFLRIGTKAHTIPWEKLAYDPTLGGYRTNITPVERTDAPVDDEKLWRDRKREREMRDHWNVPPHYGT